MRIAHCIHGLDLGGAQQVLKHIVLRSTAAGFTNFVYSPEGGVFAHEVAGAGAVVRLMPRRLPKFDPGWVVSLSRQMRRDEVDIVHTHLFGDSLHGYLAARGAGNVPVVMTLHNVANFFSPAQRFGYRWLLPRVARGVACSETVRRSFVAELAGRATAIEAIANGIAPARAGALTRDALRPLGCPRDALVVAGVGRLVEQKDFGCLVDAVAVLRREGLPVHLLLLGDGPQRRALEERAARAGVRESVSLPGFRPDVGELLHAVDVVAFSSIDEGLPMALLEAMAAARCVVATAVGGIGDAVRHGIEGLLVPPRAPRALAAALGRVLRDQNLRRRLGEAAERRIGEGFTAERMADSYVRLYRAVLEERRPAPPRAANANA